MVTGLAALAGRYSVHVVGGNLTRSPGPLMVDVTVAGVVKRRQVLTRGGARPGDEIYVSGSDRRGRGRTRDAEDLRRLRPTNPCTARYLYPEPRVRLGLMLGRGTARRRHASI